MKTIYPTLAYLILLTSTISAQISRQYNNVAIGEILHELEVNYGYTFLYSPQNVDVYQRVSIAANGANDLGFVRSILDALQIEHKPIEKKRWALREQDVVYIETRLPEESIDVSVDNTVVSAPERPYYENLLSITNYESKAIESPSRTIEHPPITVAEAQKVSIPYTKEPGKGIPARFAFVSSLSTDEINPHKGPKHLSINYLWGKSDTIIGLEMGGWANTAQTVNGFQTAGLYNQINNSHIGVQAAGLVNLVKGSSKGIQIAGLQNTVYQNSSLQIAGLVNRADTVEAQVAGLFNTADHVNKLQLGLVNVANSSDGVSVGLINIVKQGYNHAEFFVDEMFWANGQFLFGSKKFHSILKASYMRKNADYYRWGFGFGFGTRLTLSNNLGFNIQAVSTQIVENTSWENRLNLQNTLSTTFSVPIGGFELYAGPSISLLVFEPESIDSDSNKIQSTMKDYPLLLVEDFQKNTINTKSHEYLWIGFKLGIRI